MTTAVEGLHRQRLCWMRNRVYLEVLFMVEFSPCCEASKTEHIIQRQVNIVPKKPSTSLHPHHHVIFLNVTYHSTREVVPTAPRFAPSSCTPLMPTRNLLEADIRVKITHCINHRGSQQPVTHALYVTHSRKLEATRTTPRPDVSQCRRSRPSIDADVARQSLS